MMDNQYRVVINAARANSLVALFDMMRYDQATIVDWTRGHSGLLPDSVNGDTMWTLTMRGRCTRDRWLSFGMAVFNAR